MYIFKSSPVKKYIIYFKIPKPFWSSNVKIDFIKSDRDDF